MACKNKLSRLKFLKSVNKLLLVDVIATALVIALLILAFMIKNRFSNDENTLSSFKIILNCLIILLPIILFILCIVGSILLRNKLSKKHIRIQNLSSLESFAHVDILCVDKSGALTDGTLEIKKIVPLKAIVTEEYLDQWISNILRATEGNNLIANALKEKYDLQLSAGVISALPFGGGRQYFGASFKGGKNLIIGNPRYIPLRNEVGIMKRCEEYVNSGYRIFVLAEGKEQVKEDEDYEGDLDAIAIIVLKEHIRDGAFETFKWFKDNGVNIKVISSKDPLVTSVIAAEVGIENTDKYVSLEGLSIEKVKKLADTYTVFGKASSEQKEALIEAFKNKNQNVAMIGDDNSELLAMRKADCSIAVDDGDKEVVDTADIVITNSSIKPLTTANEESKRFINVFKRITSLHFARLLFALVLVIAFVIVSFTKAEGSISPYFTFNNFLILDVLINGVGGLLILIENKDEDFNYKESFIKSVLKKAVPTALLFAISVATFLILYALQNNQLINLGVYSFDVVLVMSFLAMNFIGLAYLYTMCLPLSKFRKITLIVIGSLTISLIFVDVLLTYILKKIGIILSIPYLEMNGPAYMATGIVTVVLVSIFIFIHELVSIIKGGNIKDEN